MKKDVIVKIPTPRYRLLQVFAFDPMMNSSLDTAVINNLKLSVRWEDLDPGPIGEYLEVIDVDPASNMFYPPVDLDHNYLLVQDGLSPSEGTPQFHQQMVYAVAMNTIMNFEEALGRRVLWAHHKENNGRERFVRRLRVYPHALRQANAYYSSKKIALLFGYFPASAKDVGRNLPGGIVFTCLSQDIICHETTHAILDGLHPYFSEPSNPDVLALHEAFADTVALFQHFSHPEVLKHQIAKTRGNLARQNLLAQLAQQTGEAIGKRGALRNALGKKPNPLALEGLTEPHDRGSILVAAIFNAFLTVYKARVADLMRIATGGTGILQKGEIHPDLVNRMAEEASRVSKHILTMCIRALDYCPPVDITFGEYLRAIITADIDMNQADREGYRIAMIESFRQYGIYPPAVRNLSQESLIWHAPTEEDEQVLAGIFDQDFIGLVNKYEQQLRKYQHQRETICAFNNNLRNEIKERLIKATKERAIRVDYQSIESKNVVGMLEDALNLQLEPKTNLQSILTQTGSGEPENPEFDVNSVRLAQRIDEHGKSHNQLVVEITQRRRGYLSQARQEAADKGNLPASEKHDFIFRGGVTMLIDIETNQVCYIISKNVGSNRRLAIQRKYLSEPETSLAYTYFGKTKVNYFRGDENPREPFALLHGDENLEV